MEITELKSHYHFEQKMVGTLSLHQFINLMRKISSIISIANAKISLSLLLFFFFLPFITNCMKLDYTGLKMVNH